MATRADLEPQLLLLCPQRRRLEVCDTARNTALNRFRSSLCVDHLDVLVLQEGEEDPPHEAATEYAENDESHGGPPPSRRVSEDVGKCGADG